MKNTPIISVSGLRGIVGHSLDPVLASRYVAAFVSKLDAGPVVVTRDGRTTGPMLASAICAALAAVGREVMFGDVAATPTTGVLVRENNAAGGVQISASHNPPEYNGIKLFGSDGRVISADLGEAVRAAYNSQDPVWVDHFKVGRINGIQDTLNAHLAKVLKTVDVEAIRNRQFRVLLNANHGAGSLLAARLFAELNVQSKFVGGTPDGLFTNPPEPTEVNLAEFCGLVGQGEYDVAFAQDPDADRLAVMDETGNYIGEEMTLAITLDHALRTRKGPVVINCATSRMSVDIAANHQCECILSAVGEANVCDQMIQSQAVYGGEGNGGPIDPMVGYVRDSFVGMAQVLDRLAAENRSVSEIVAGLPSYSIVKTVVNLDRDKIHSALDAIESRFSDARPSRLDGLRLDWDDRWVLIRASNTEPIVRVISEANSRESANALCEQARAVIDSL